jgi:hypothetical protein
VETPGPASGRRRGRDAAIDPGNAGIGTGRPDKAGTVIRMNLYHHRDSKIQRSSEPMRRSIVIDACHTVRITDAAAPPRPGRRPDPAPPLAAPPTLLAMLIARLFHDAWRLPPSFDCDVVDIGDDDAYRLVLRDGRRKLGRASVPKDWPAAVLAPGLAFHDGRFVRRTWSPVGEVTEGEVWLFRVRPVVLPSGRLVIEKDSVYLVRRPEGGLEVAAGPFPAQASVTGVPLPFLLAAS